MAQRSVVAVGTSLLVASLALAGCGTRGDDSGSDSGSGSSGNKTVKIGVISPLSGDLAALGKGISNSVDIAIKQANDSKAIAGWTSELAAEDDQATPDVGKNAARIRAFHAAGVRHLIVDLVGPYEQRAEKIDAFAATVLPLPRDLRGP